MRILQPAFALSAVLARCNKAAVVYRFLVIKTNIVYVLILTKRLSVQVRLSSAIAAKSTTRNLNASRKLIRGVLTASTVVVAWKSDMAVCLVKMQMYLLHLAFAERHSGLANLRNLFIYYCAPFVFILYRIASKQSY